MEEYTRLTPFACVIDTNILIAYIKGEDAVVEQIKSWREQGVSLFVSSIAECELLSYPQLSKEEEVVIEHFLSDNFVPIPFDGLRARQAALLRRHVSSLKLPDAAIAALAMETNATLITRNIRDFRKITGLLWATL